MTRWILGFVVWGWSTALFAIPVSIDFSGVNVNVVGESINAVPVPASDVEFATSFEPAQTVTGSIAFDTSQPDVDPDPDVGTYLIGSLSVQIPQLGLTASRASSAMQISSFNDTANPDDQFFAFVDGVDVFVTSIGVPDPVSFDVLLFGDTSMLSDDQLPTGPLDWTFGNVSFFFIASDNTRRQVLLEFSPADVAEPASLSLLTLALAGIGLSSRRKRV